MKVWGYLLIVMMTLIALEEQGFTQPAESPEEAGITPVTGDMVPWREFVFDTMNFDNVWIIALNNGDVVAFKRGNEFDKPGVIGGSEFLIIGPDGSLKTERPIRGSFNADSDPTPYIDYGTTGLAWGAFTLGAHADRANGEGFVVHNQGENAQTFNLDHGDEVGDQAFSMIQLFENDGTPIGSNINAFGSLTGAEGGYRDIGAAILSNGDIVVIGEDRQVSDELLDLVNTNANEVVIATILAPDRTTRFDPFVPHTDENGQYLGGSSSAVYQNVTTFEGGFVIDYNQGIRWYNNDGSPITPVQSDHAELDGTMVDLEVILFFFGSNSGGRGDGMALANNGDDLVVKSFTLSSEEESIGVLVYYNTDGTVRDWVRFDDVDLVEEPSFVGRTFCDMDQNGNVFVVWEDQRFGGTLEGGHTQVFGRFFDRDGEAYGPSFPVYENWTSEPIFVDFGGSIGQVPRGDQEQPRCALNNEVGAVISASTLMPDIPKVVKELSSAFDLVLNEPIIRIFENPFSETSVSEWSLY